jgi:hypothetical protein
VAAFNQGLKETSSVDRQNAAIVSAFAFAGNMVATGVSAGVVILGVHSKAAVL